MESGRLCAFLNACEFWWWQLSLTSHSAALQAMERKTMIQNEDGQTLTMYLPLKVSANIGTIKGLANVFNRQDFLKQSIIGQIASPVNSTLKQDFASLMTQLTTSRNTCPQSGKGVVWWLSIGQGGWSHSHRSLLFGCTFLPLDLGTSNGIYCSQIHKLCNNERLQGWTWNPFKAGRK